MKQLSISKNIHVTEPVSGLSLRTMKTGKTVVTIMGSFLGGRSFSPSENKMLADLVVLSLDEGTKKHTKEEIRNKLESIGASIDFSCSSNRIHFEARMTKEHVPEVISLLMEQLRYPAFPARELVTVKKRAIAKLEHVQHETKPRAENVFLQTLYPKNHPLYRPDFATQINLIKKTNRQQLLNYHKEVFGLNSFNMVVVGDINTREVNAAVKKSFGNWKDFPYITHLPHPRKGKNPTKSSLTVTIFDKASTDMFMGSTLPITKQHKDYFALLVALKILGGGFTSRLMQSIREERGLTYGIYASQIIEDRDKGHWFVWGTFSPQLLAQGRIVVANELSTFAAKGVRTHEFSLMKEHIVGAYAVELSSTAGMAQAILNYAEDERLHTFIDDFIEIISKIKLSHVNEVIKKYIHPDQLTYVAAGSIDKKGKPL